MRALEDFECRFRQANVLVDGDGSMKRGQIDEQAVLLNLVEGDNAQRSACAEDRAEVPAICILVRLDAHVRQLASTDRLCQVSVSPCFAATFAVECENCGSYDQFVNVVWQVVTHRGPGIVCLVSNTK